MAKSGYWDWGLNRGGLLTICNSNLGAYSRERGFFRGFKVIIMLVVKVIIDIYYNK